MGQKHEDRKAPRTQAGPGKIRRAVGSPAARAGGGSPRAPQVAPSPGRSLAVQGVPSTTPGVGEGSRRASGRNKPCHGAVRKPCGIRAGDDSGSKETSAFPRCVTCRESGCNLIVLAFGLCRMHYDRAYRTRRRGQGRDESKGRGQHYRKYRSRSAGGAVQKRRAPLTAGGPPAPRRVDLPMEHTAGRCESPDCGWLTILRGRLCYVCSGWIYDQPPETMDWRPERGPVKLHLPSRLAAPNRRPLDDGVNEW